MLNASLSVPILTFDTFDPGKSGTPSMSNLPPVIISVGKLILALMPGKLTETLPLSLPELSMVMIASDELPDTFDGLSSQLTSNNAAETMEPNGNNDDDIVIFPTVLPGQYTYAPEVQTLLNVAVTPA